MNEQELKPCPLCHGKGYIEKEVIDKHDGNIYEKAGEYVTLYRWPCNHGKSK